MTTDDRRGGQDGATRQPYAKDDVDDDEISLQPLVRGIWLYRRVISGVVAGVMMAFAVASLVAYVRMPAERMGILGFRLLFEGAADGHYPNGTPFSSAEITSTPVLTEVFDANGLDRFGLYEDFKNSIFILQSNPELDLLSYEYQTKLADSRLTPVDRARIEEEFQRKRESLVDPLFSLNLRRDGRVATMPPSLVSKVLDDTLAVWARQAEERKGALLYDIPILSTNILRRDLLETEDYLTGVDILRTQVMRIIANVDEIKRLPGAMLIRVGGDRGSLVEAGAALEDILRFEVQPLLGIIRVSGLSKSAKSLALYIDDQLFQRRLEGEEAQKRVEAIQEALRGYMRQRGAVAAPELGSGSSGLLFGSGSQGMIPQLGESFLDRLVEMSTTNSDVAYRQNLTNRIIGERVAMAALEREQAYYEEIRAALERAASSPREVDGEVGASNVMAKFEKALEGVVVVVEQVNAIYEELSAHNLNPATLLYTVTTPFTMRTERALLLRTVALYGTLVFMLSLVFVPLGCLVHSYFRREIVHRQTEEQSAGRALGAKPEGQREEQPAERTASV